MLTLRTTATVTKINRKSSSPCFKDLKVGDVIEFSVPIVRVGRHRGTYATYILCHNCRTDVESQLSLTKLRKCLNVVNWRKTMNDKKYCPMKYSKGGYCEKENCAWYYTYSNGEGECAIRSLPGLFDGLDEIAGAINRK